MAQPLSAQRFLISSEGVLIRKELEVMVGDANYNTESFYSPTSSERISFVDKHMDYLCKHPLVKPRQYLSNLRLMTRKHN